MCFCMRVLVREERDYFLLENEKKRRQAEGGGVFMDAFY